MTILCLALFLTSMTAPALGAAPVKVQATVVMNGPQATMLPAGDDANHAVGLGQRQGKAVFSDGREAEYSNVFFLDLFRGQYANSWGYTKMRFGDGSWIFFRWEAAFAGLDQAGKPTFAGTGTIQKGTGAYAGIQGQVKFANRQLPQSKEHPQGATEAKAEITYTLP